MSTLLPAADRAGNDEADGCAAIRDRLGAVHDALDAWDRATARLEVDEDRLNELRIRISEAQRAAGAAEVEEITRGDRSGAAADLRSSLNEARAEYAAVEARAAALRAWKDGEGLAKLEGAAAELEAAWRKKGVAAAKDWQPRMEQALETLLAAVLDGLAIDRVFGDLGAHVSPAPALASSWYVLFEEVLRRRPDLGLREDGRERWMDAADGLYVSAEGIRDARKRVLERRKRRQAEIQARRDNRLAG